MQILIKKLFLIVFPFLLLSCVRDNPDDCGIYLEFIFDHNMEYADSFNPQVKSVDILVFDEMDHLILHKHAESSELVNNKQMYLTDDIAFGTYKVITIGGQSEQIRMITYPDDNSETVSLRHVQLALQSESNNIDFEFPHVWYGSIITINYVENRSVWPVRLIRNTNKFSLMLQGIDTEDFSMPDTPPFTFEIVTPEAGIYDYNNQPLVYDPVSYLPYSLTMVNEPENTSVGRLNTMRLIDDQIRNNYQLIIRQTDNGEAVWSCDLIQLLKNTKPTTRPDDTILPLQEYLDRQGEWAIEMLYREIMEQGKKNFVGISISVNGWILWLNEMEV